MGRLGLWERQEWTNRRRVDPELQGLHLQDDVHGVEYVRGGKHRGVLLPYVRLGRLLALAMHMRRQPPYRFVGLLAAHSQVSCAVSIYAQGYHFSGGNSSQEPKPPRTMRPFCSTRAREIMERNGKRQGAYTPHVAKE